MVDISIDVIIATTHAIPYFASVPRQAAKRQQNAIQIGNRWVLNSFVDREVFHLQSSKYFESALKYFFICTIIFIFY